MYIIISIFSFISGALALGMIRYNSQKKKEDERNCKECYCGSKTKKEKPKRYKKVPKVKVEYKRKHHL